MDPDLLIAKSIFQHYPSEAIFPLVAMILLLIGSAFTSASEVAYFSLSPIQKVELGETKSLSAKRVVEVLKLPEELLASLLILNNSFNLGLILLSTLASDLIFNFEDYPILAVSLQTFFVTFLILVFGEVIPKTYATNHGLKWTKKSSKIVKSAIKILRPISSALVKSSKFIDRFSIIKSLTVDELEEALDLTSDEATTPDQQRLLREIVRFGSTSVKQIMTPRQEIFAIDAESSIKNVLESVSENGYSRVPIFKENMDNISGILHAKDLLNHLDAKLDYLWTDLLRPAFFVTENMKIDNLLGEFRQKKMHMAVVVDEFGGISGITTLEDVMEEIVGEIHDEFDSDEQLYSQLDKSTFVFEARAQLTDLYRVLDINPETLEEFRGEADTVAGILLEQLGRMPLKGESLIIGPLKWTVEAADGRRIVRVKVNLIENEI
ncbi:MAG: Magnesium and cobalt efflux protein CorC [Owenweeksia sp. TMED14]|nr:MAG: Magnesium and cobalt efflux protein CorC [Owenweeksia sp. TMED14]